MNNKIVYGVALALVLGGLILLFVADYKSAPKTPHKPATTCIETP